jgi:protein-disulfide isomerase
LRSSSNADGTANPPTWVDRLALLTLLLAGLAGSIIVMLWLLAGRPNRSAPGDAPDRLQDETFSTLVSSGNRLGDTRAPAVLLVYNDYRCGFCLELHRNLERLRARYPQHLSIIYKNFVETSSAIGRQYLVPLGVACAAEQDAFEEYHVAAFSNTHVLEYADAPWILAEAAAIPDTAAFRVCMESRRYVTDVRVEYDEARQLGVRGTPTLFLNGIPIVGSVPLGILDSLIVSELPRPAKYGSTG